MIRALAASLLSAASVIAQGWTEHTPTNPLSSPGNRAFPAMCWDAAHGYVLMFGGAPINGGVSQQTWSWNGTAWSQIPTIAPPAGGFFMQYPQYTAMSFHAPDNRVVMVDQGSTWLFTGSNWLLHPAPIVVPLLGGMPCHIAMGYDPVSQRTVLYVGATALGGTMQFVGLTYTWDGLGWTLRTTATVPYPWQFPTMAFDPGAGRLVLGTTGNGSSQFFEWTGSNWQQRFPTAAPAAPGVFATDTTHQRLVMFDGAMNVQPNHTWTLANGTLQQLSTPLEPARRFGAAMAYDPLRDRVVLFGGTPLWNYGSGTSIAFGDTWEFQLGQGASYTTYGSGCAGSRGVPHLAASFGSVPRAGQVFQATVTNVPLQGPVFLFVGLSNTNHGPIPLPFSLGVIGAPSCDLLCSGDDLALLTNVLGTAFWQWQVPPVPGATFYNQAIVFDPTANALGLTLSNGAAGTIGF
ncbi:MAG TPA: hypothetical protein VFZ65_22575 [Planctomycetota bacterium]|nr:hypothetical protein [Planctomycetota bacterium]